MATVHAPVGGAQDSGGPSSSAGTTRAVTDIRSLTAEKQPRSANDMVALVAYYLSELAPQTERSETINLDAIRKYFKMAGFPLPSVLRNVLPNVASAGYLENVSRGEYRLNPVGYNLVVHGLPRSGSPGPSSRSDRRFVVSPVGRPAQPRNASADGNGTAAAAPSGRCDAHRTPNHRHVVENSSGYGGIVRAMLGRSWWSTSAFLSRCRTRDEGSSARGA